mmetsp:Transcript_35086/g.75906  ORF Transcript_35086/g.75906 Transcript_35086/m.75906 type:complete len:261 (+) Transcript_35086:109-891(+)
MIEQHVVLGASSRLVCDIRHVPSAQVMSVSGNNCDVSKSLKYFLPTSLTSFWYAVMSAGDTSRSPYTRSLSCTRNAANLTCSVKKVGSAMSKPWNTLARWRMEKDKVGLEQALVVLRRLGDDLGGEQPVQNKAQRLNKVEIKRRGQMLEVLLKILQCLGDVMVEQPRQDGLALGGVLALVDPALHKRVPLLALGDEHNTSARHRGRRRETQVTQLKHKTHGGLELDAFVGRKGEQAVVVHDRVHRFNLAANPLKMSPMER